MEDKKVQLKIINITDSEAEVGAFAILLGEINGDRQLPIIIGASEAQSTLLILHNIKPLRPLTHDLMTTCLDELKAQITEVLIYRAENGVFFSYIYLNKGENEIVQIDSRTSDAIALAIRCNSPIYIYESILNQECITVPFDNEAEQEIKREEQRKEDELKKAKNKKHLESELEKAIIEENYELAALIRDELLKDKN